MFTLEEFVVQTGSTSSLPPEMLVLHGLRGPEPERKWAQTSIRMKKMVLHCLFFFSLISGTSATRRSFNKKTVQCWITFLMFVAACLAWDNNELTIRQNDAKNTKHQEKGTKKTQLIGKASAFQHVLSSPNALQRTPRRFIARRQGMCLLYYSHRRWRVGCEYILMRQLMRFWVGLRTICYICMLHSFVPGYLLSVPLDMRLCQLTGLSRSVQVFLMLTRFKNFRKHRWAHRCFSSIVLGFGQTWGDGYTHILCWPHARAFPELSRYVIISSWLGSFQPQRLHVLMFEFGCLVSLVTPIWK